MIAKRTGDVTPESVHLGSWDGDKADSEERDFGTPCK